MASPRFTRLLRSDEQAQIEPHRWNNFPPTTVRYRASGIAFEQQYEGDRFELFLLGEGEKKVTVEPETRVPSAATFKFVKEDHTLANLLRSQLTRNDHVLFSGYKVPHPLFADFELRVQTDGSLTPREAVVQACREIVQDLDVLGREFLKEWELKRISRAGDGINGI